MRAEKETSTNSMILAQGSSTNRKKEDELESNSLPLNATSTPAITSNGKIINTNTTTNATANGGHSPSLMPVSVKWISQNPNLLGKFLEYYQVQIIDDRIKTHFNKDY